mmetsp:Transcript_11908/g.31472  ORF Transcript_11908/g.31472 Transcript_11908/m.31472 type:complete len:220 (-) Transcript_11908:1597-2256(-)
MPRAPRGGPRRGRPPLRPPLRLQKHRRPGQLAHPRGRSHRIRLRPRRTRRRRRVRRRRRGTQHLRRLLRPGTPLHLRHGPPAHGPRHRGLGRREGHAAARARAEIRRPRVRGRAQDPGRRARRGAPRVRRRPQPRVHLRGPRVGSRRRALAFHRAASAGAVPRDAPRRRHAAQGHGVRVLGQAAARGPGRLATRPGAVRPDADGAPAEDPDGDPRVGGG